MIVTDVTGKHYCACGLYRTQTDASLPQKSFRQSANKAIRQTMTRVHRQIKRYNAQKPPFHVER